MQTRKTAVEIDLRTGNPVRQEDRVFIEVGAYHPFKYSNTLFFEKCLGWKGLCVEPNPYQHHLFRTYRKATLVPNCVWSETKTVTMKFSKDMIEAAVPDDEGDIPDINVGGHHEKGSNTASTAEIHRKFDAEVSSGPGQKCAENQPNCREESEFLPISAQNPPSIGKSGSFDAICLSLAAIIRHWTGIKGYNPPFGVNVEPSHWRENEFGQRVIDYISLDAEHAEYEILRVFPFEEFDVRVWVIEVQPDNFFKIDSLLMYHGYAKFGVLGGDHVYGKIGNVLTKLDFPSNALDIYKAKANDTHGLWDFRQPKIEYAQKANLRDQKEEIERRKLARQNSEL